MKLDNKGEFSLSSILSVAIALIIAAFVLIPGFRNFADLLMGNLTDYWDNTISSKIFPSQ